MRDHDLLRDPEADAGSLRLGRVVRLKNRADFLRRDTRAAVADLDHQELPGAVGADFHPAVSVNRLERIDHQVEQRLDELVAISL